MRWTMMIGVAGLVLPLFAGSLTFLASFRLKQSAVALQAFGVPEVVVVLKGFFDAVKGAPLWLALAAAGVGLIVLGSLYGGYRFAAGGITSTPAPTAVAAPTPTQTPIPETST